MRAARYTRPSQSKPVARAATPPAQAASVLTSTPAPDEPLDLSDTFVVGSAVTYAGGTTSPKGTSTRSAPGLSSPADAGSVGEVGSTGPDRSRKAHLSGGSEWNCPFPPEADRDHVDRAIVTIHVAIALDGTPEAVEVVHDPGHGFARATRSCAFGRRWDPALDREGRPVEGTILLNVRFDR